METRLDCLNCGPVFGPMTMRIEIHFGAGNQGFYEDETLNSLMNPWITAACAECHYEANIPVELESSAKDFIFNLLKEKLTDLKSRTVSAYVDHWPGDD